MNKQSIFFLVSFVIFGLTSIAQPYVVNEKVEKVFSEGFTDVNDHFAITPSSDSKFWGTYADGYYYMERKVASPRAIVANADAVSKNFYIKSKIMLGPNGNMESSVGVMFLVQPGGKGGFVFEFNKKKNFRIKDLGTGAFITKEGNEGWLKSKIIAPATRSNTIEIKSFRGKFDIYLNGSYLYSFVNSSYQKGKFGVYLGPSAAANMYYFNVYELDIPGAAPEINISSLYDQIEALKAENDSLRTVALTIKFGGNDKAAISAIKILEEQLRARNEENAQIKSILKEYEANEAKASPENVKADQDFTNGLVDKISNLSAERDSVVNSVGPLKNKLFQVSYQRDSLRDTNLQLEKKMTFLEEHMKEVQAEIENIKKTKNNDTVQPEEKVPSTPSKVAELPKMPESIPTPQTVGATELVKQDSTYSHTIDIDEEIGIDEGSDEGLFNVEPEEKKIKLVPLKRQKIKVKKATKAEFKD